MRIIWWLNNPTDFILKVNNHFFFKELATLKAKELYQAMEKAQELAQGSKQEQHTPDLAQKAHDVSALQSSLGGGKYKSLSLSVPLVVEI